MYIPGTLILFETIDAGEDEPSRFYLKCLESDPWELKMEGGLPGFWSINRGKVAGPDIGDGERRYRIIRIDRKKRWVWIMPCN